jgi:hypothetical protein
MAEEAYEDDDGDGDADQVEKNGTHAVLLRFAGL